MFKLTLNIILQNKINNIMNSNECNTKKDNQTEFDKKIKFRKLYTSILYTYYILII